MKIIAGTVNEHKIKSIKDALKGLHLEYKIEGVEVPSEITDQPLDRNTTEKGAINRAKNAKQQNPDADLWVGLEGGLHDYGEGYHLVTYCCLIDNDDKQYIDQGEEIHLPEKVSEEVKKGRWFGDVIREYAKDNEINENLITRIEPFTHAVQCAYVEYLKTTSDLGYRKKTSAMVIDEQDNYLIVQLNEYAERDWNFPGGGIEKGEKAEVAILRELEEELGTDNFEIIQKSKHINKYDWPNALVARDISQKKDKIYRGQEVTLFLVKFTGEKDEITPDPAELRRVKWVKFEELEKHFYFHNLLELAQKLKKEFNL